jgi:hypothetical protein
VQTVLEQQPFNADLAAISVGVTRV